MLCAPGAEPTLSSPFFGPLGWMVCSVLFLFLFFHLFIMDIFGFIGDGSVVNGRLRDMAIGLGMCERFSRQWVEDLDAGRLLEMYKEGLDFCMEHDFPSNADILACFDRDVLRSHHIYVDERDGCFGGFSDICVVQGDSDLEFRFGGYDYVTIYVRHRSRVRVVAGGYSIVNLVVFDDGEVSYSEDGGSVCLISGK